MQLTWISWSFKFTLLLLGLLYIVIAWVFEKRISQALVKAFAQVRKRLSSRPKKRKAYKIILEKMRI